MHGSYKKETPFFHRLSVESARDSAVVQRIMWGSRVSSQFRCPCPLGETSTCRASARTVHTRIVSVHRDSQVMRGCGGSGSRGMYRDGQGERPGNIFGVCDAQRDLLRGVGIRENDLDVKRNQMGMKVWGLGLGLMYQMWLGVPGASADEAASNPDIATSVLFFTAIAALSVLTVGVAYLSITSWLDDRQEKKDSERRPKDQYNEEMDRYQDSINPKKSKKKPLERSTPKGFGSGKRE